MLTYEAPPPAGALTCGCSSLSRRMKLEKELVAQLWRISWEDLQMSNLDKVLRSGSRITLSLVRFWPDSTLISVTMASLHCDLTRVFPERLQLRLPDHRGRKPAGLCKDRLL